jgi:cobalt-zinc-cadmium efflux system outer membrane protein
MQSTYRKPGKAGLAALALGLLLTSSPAPLHAEDRGLDLRQAVEKALAENKRIVAFRHRLVEQSGRVRQAGRLPNPEILVELENVGGSGFFGGVDGAETTLSIAWAIEPGLRGRRVGIARARSSQIDLEARLLQLDVAAETAQRFLSCLESQLHLRAGDEAVALAEQTLAVVERRVRAGSAAKSELMRAQATLATERLAREDVTHELSVAYHWLAAQWGEAAPSFSRVDGELLELPRTTEFTDLEARLERNPTLERLASEQRIAEARLSLARAQRWPTLKPSLGARRFERTDDWALVASLSLPLPVFDRKQGQLTESQARLARTAAEIEAERVRTRAALYEIHQELQHSVHRAEVLADEVLPRLEASMDEIRRGYERGRYAYFELRTIQADLLAARRSRVEASTAAHRFLITLERLTGEGMQQ